MEKLDWLPVAVLLALFGYFCLFPEKVFGVMDWITLLALND
jgi:hypothetical protein